MPGLGLQGAYGAQGFADKLHELVLENEKRRLMAEAVQREQAQQEAENEFRRQQIGLQRDQMAGAAEDRKVARQDRESAAKDLESNRNVEALNKLIDNSAPDQDLTEAVAPFQSSTDPRVRAVIAGLKTDANIWPQRGPVGIRLKSPKQAPQPSQPNLIWQTRSDGTQVRVPDVPGVVSDRPQPSGKLTENQEGLMVQRLGGEWDKAVAPIVEMNRAVNLMDAGLRAARNGDMNAGSQAVLVTFQKILDPQSVVRESEYARSPQGIAMLSRVQGAFEKLSKGGAGVPLEELEQFSRLADDAINALSTGYIQEVRGRTQNKLKRYGIPDDLVLTDLPTRPKPMPPVSERVAGKTTWTFQSGPAAGVLMVWDGVGWVPKGGQ